MASEPARAATTAAPVANSNAATHALHMQAAKSLEAQPIIIYRTVDRDGQTFALDPLSKRRLLDEAGKQLKLPPRVFIAHASKADMKRLRKGLARQVAELLIGVSASQLDDLGGVEFRDSATDQAVLTI